MIKRGKAEKSAARSERLSTALRENLKRRKAQARERDMERGLARNPASGADSVAKDATTEPPAPEFHRNPGPE
jgi:hypothetical protein